MLPADTLPCSSSTDSLRTTPQNSQPTPTAASCASTTAASTYVRINSPTLYSRASTTYETQANMQKITACTWEWNVKTYVADKHTSIGYTIIADAMEGAMA